MHGSHCLIVFLTITALTSYMTVFGMIKYGFSVMTLLRSYERHYSALAAQNC